MLHGETDDRPSPDARKAEINVRELNKSAIMCRILCENNKKKWNEVLKIKKTVQSNSNINKHE